MATAYLGEIRVFSFGFAPRGWALCNGQLLPISQNQALFSLLGTQYGGDGIRTFQLPNLQASMPIHAGNGFVQGSIGGQPTHTLTTLEMPAHSHIAQGVTTQATLAGATGATWAMSAQSPYTTTPNTSLAPGALETAGGSQPHDNMPPYLTLNFCIALQGNFPSRN